jgi:proline iminopeptidase
MRFSNFGIPSSKLFLNITDFSKDKKTITDITETNIKKVQVFFGYAKNLYFIDEKKWLTREAMSSLDKIPTTIIKSRYDFDCPPEQGFTLSRLLPNAEFIMVEGAGHKTLEKNNFDAIIKALD